MSFIPAIVVVMVLVVLIVGLSAVGYWAWKYINE